jgi:hypothetical protein
VDSELFFKDGPRNRALSQLRATLAEFIDDYEPDLSGRFQWPRNVEL